MEAIADDSICLMVLGDVSQLDENTPLTENLRLVLQTIYNADARTCLLSTLLEKQDTQKNSGSPEEVEAGRSTDRPREAHQYTLSYDDVRFKVKVEFHKGTDPKCVGDMNEFLWKLRQRRFRGLLLIVMFAGDTSAETAIQKVPQGALLGLSGLLPSLFDEAPSSSWLEYLPGMALQQVTSWMDNLNPAADYRIIHVQPKRIVIKSAIADVSSMSRPLVFQTSNGTEGSTQGEWQHHLRNWIWTRSAFLKMGSRSPRIPSREKGSFNRDIGEGPSRISGTSEPIDAVRRLVTKWVTIDASPWNHKLVVEGILDLIDQNCYVTNRFQTAVTLTTLLRLARWMAVQNLEGTPLSTTFFAYPELRQNGGKWQELFDSKDPRSDSKESRIRPVFKPDSMNVPVSLNYRHKIKQLAEILMDGRGFLKLDLSDGHIIGICEDAPDDEHCRLDRFRNLTRYGGIVVHARPEGFVEVFSNGEFVLWFDGFDWHAKPFGILISVLERFFQNPGTSEEEQDMLVKRVTHVVADLLDHERSSIIVLATDEAITGYVQPDLERPRGDTAPRLFKTTREGIKDLDFGTIHKPHLYTLRNILSADGAHFIEVNGEIGREFEVETVSGEKETVRPVGLIFDPSSVPNNSNGDVRTKAGSGTSAAQSLSKHLGDGSFVLKVSGSGDLKIFHRGERLWSSDPATWYEPASASQKTTPAGGRQLTG